MMSAMKTKAHTTLFLTLLVTYFLTACSAHQKTGQIDSPVQSRDTQTADLADIVGDTLDLLKSTNKDKILVVFDIDNTIMAMEQGLGSDQWYEWQKGLSEIDPCNPKSVGDRFAAQGSLYFASAMRPTQTDGAAQVRAIQATGVPVIALTARGMDFRLQTFRELRRNGFSFSYSAIGPQGGYMEPFMPIKDGRLSLYEDGVFLTAGQHKGQMLYALLEKTGFGMPSVIVMADDKQKNLDAIKETFSALDVPVHAWRYTGEDENVSGFDPELANTQWQSIEAPLRQIQQVLGPDNYDLTGAVLPPECAQPLPSSPVSGD